MKSRKIYPGFQAESVDEPVARIFILLNSSVPIFKMMPGAPSRWISSKMMVEPGVILL